MIKNDAELARHLGVDRAVVSRDKKRGMPTSSLEAAHAWRQQHLSAAHRKDLNPARVRAAASRANVGVEELRNVKRLLPVAKQALQAGIFDAVAPKLRRALRDVPPPAREKVVMDVALWDALCLPTLKAWGIQPQEDTPGAPAAPDSLGGNQAIDRALYCVASGEPIPAEWLGL